MKVFLSRKLNALLIVLGLMALLPASTASSSSLIVATVLSSDQLRYRNAHKSFVRALSAKGYDESSIELITQVPNPDPISWSNSIRKFNAIGANIIITFGAPVTLAALQESHDIPIVFADAYAPLEAGIVKSLATPGNNATGVSSKVPLSTLVKAAMNFSSFKRIGVIHSSREIGSVIQSKEMKRLALQNQFSVIESVVDSSAALDSALATLLTQVDCLYLTESSLAGKHLEKIIRRAIDQRVPVISQIPYSGEKGALISLEANPHEMGSQAAEIAAKVISGKKPAIIPVVMPKKIDLVVNMKTARALELNVPIQVVNMATKIIK